MTDTLITAQVDFDANGKQHGYLRVPHSVHRSAYGWIPVPITVIRNGSGPTLVISAGVHGDEYEGQIAIANLARDLHAAEINGRLILLPMMNHPAAEAGCRYVADAAKGTRALNVRGSVYANEAGVFEPMKTIGDGVAQGETVAHIHHPETPGKAADVVLSPYAGMALAMRAMAQVRRGDALYQIATDAN